MVLKRSNCAVNSGNTMRPRYFNTCCKPKKSAEHWIIKFYLNPIIQPADFQRQTQDILSACDEYIEDGSMQIMKDFRSPVVLSMNKLKRWLLPDVIKDTIMSNISLKDEAFKVTLSECEQDGIEYCVSRNRGNCVGYSDSQNEVAYVSPHKSHSYLTDLRESGKGGDGQKLKDSRRKKYHNLHKRGIQRPERRDLDPNPEQDPPRRNILPGLAERHGCPEIRYEAISPAEFNSSKRNFQHYCSRKWSYWYYSPNRRSIRKSKGLVNKPDFAERFWGYNVLEMQEDARLEKRYPNGKGEEWMWQVEYEEVEKRETTFKVALENLIVKKKSSKRKKKHKKSEDQENLQGGYVFVDMEKKVQVKVKVEQISRASCLWTKKYGKGHAVVAETQTGDEVSQEDFVMVDPTDEPTDSGDQLGEEVLEVLRSNVKMFNDTFCVCKVLMSEIMPRKLVEVCGSEVEVKISLIHPYTFVLDLGQWSMVCQISPGLGLWPDPESQNVVTVRIVLQGGSTETFMDINTSLHNAVKEDVKHVYSLKSLIDIASKVIEDHQDEKSIQTKTTRSNTSVHKTIFQQLFSGLVVVKTARDVHREYKRSLGILPSIARINIFDLIELDLSLVEECSICFASWEGDKWSWVSHNMTLLPCQHSFCRQCWQMYLCHNIRQGKTTLLCMEYGCKTEIDATTVASLVPPSLFTRWQHQCDENHVAQEGGWEWCPRPSCQYLAKKVLSLDKKPRLQSQYGFSVKCHCGELWCFLCKKEPHWPALCSHSDLYHKMLIQKGDDRSKYPADDVATYFVNVKRCPQCKHPMEKNGGCSHMKCRCSFDFCWECLGPWSEHFSNGLVCSTNKKEETTMELDNSVNLSLPVCHYKDSVTHRHAWQHLSMSTISRLSSQFVSLQRSTKQWARNLTSMTKPDQTQTFIKNTLMFVRDMHMLLENCSVLLSNTTRSCRPQSLVACRAQLAFINTRIEATLNMPKAQRDKMLTRIKSLTYMAWSTIDKLVLLIPGAQFAIDTYARERSQDREKSELGVEK